MRVLVISSLYPPHALGGYELACSDVMTRWQRAGHDVTVLTSRASLGGVTGASPQQDVHRRLTVYYAGPPGVRYPRRRYHPALMARDHWWLGRALRDAQPDVVSIWHPGSLSITLLGRLAQHGLPVVYVVCDDWPLYAPRSDPTGHWLRRTRWFAQDLGPHGRWVFCSEALRDAVLASSSWTISAPEVVPLGVDPETFPPRPASDRPWQGRVLFVGRLAPEKGVDTAIRALGLLPQGVTLDLVGRGSAAYVNELSRLAADLGVSERLRIDALERSALPERYAAADVLVFPSRWPEPFGIVPLEAMACATPVVATGTGGSADYLLDGTNCLLFAAGDPAGLAAAIARLADDRRLRGRLVEAGTTTAGELTVDRLASRLEAIHLAVA